MPLLSGVAGEIVPEGEIARLMHQHNLTRRQAIELGRKMARLNLGPMRGDHDPGSEPYRP